MEQEQIGQLFEHVLRVEPSLDADRQALTGKLVDDAEHPINSSIMSPVLDEVVAPDMARILRPEPHAGAVVQPQTPAFGLLLRDLQPLPPPDAIDALLVHVPPVAPQQSGDPAIAIATISLS